MQQLKFGSITVDALSDGELFLPMAGAYPGANVEAFRKHGGITSDGSLSAQLMTFVIRAGGRTVLVDTGMGPTLGPFAAMMKGNVGELPGRLKAAAVDPDRVDAVVMTHLHGDHIGWNTVSASGDSAPKPMFPNARYIVTRKDWEHRETVAGPEMLASCLIPVEKSGQLTLVDDGYEPAPGVRLLFTPGHTPGHTSVLVSDGGEGGIITGDAAGHPATIEDPTIAFGFDSDQAQSEKSRFTLVKRAEEEGLVIMGGHFPPPTAGRVVRVGDKRTWHFIGA